MGPLRSFFNTTETVRKSDRLQQCVLISSNRNNLIQYYYDRVICDFLVSQNFGFCFWFLARFVRLGLLFRLRFSLLIFLVFRPTYLHYFNSSSFDYIPSGYNIFAFVFIYITKIWFAQSCCPRLKSIIASSNRRIISTSFLIKMLPMGISNLFAQVTVILNTSNDIVASIMHAAALWLHHIASNAKLRKFYVVPVFSFSISVVRPYSYKPNQVCIALITFSSGKR